MSGRRKIQLRSCPLELGLEALDLDLKGARVDLKQQLAFGHVRALGELHGLDEAADPRMHLDGIDRLQLSGELRPVVERPGDELRDGYSRLWRCSIRRLMGL